MSDDEEEYEDGEEEEDEGGEEEGEEGVDEAAAKQALVKEDISLILDVFAYIDRTSKRMASRLELESAMVAPRKGPHFPSGVGMNHIDADLGDVERLALEGDGSAGDVGFNPTWSNYENLTEAERGMLLEKAIRTLGEQPPQVIVTEAASRDHRPRRK
jgi:hypothetical protein